MIQSHKAQNSEMGFHERLKNECLPITKEQ